MSRVGKKPIDIPAGISVEVNGSCVSTKGPKGELKYELPLCVAVQIQDNQILLSANDESTDPQKIALWGLSRALIANNIKGVKEGYTEALLLVGTGYRAQASKLPNGLFKIDFTLGLSHPLDYIAPEGISIECPTATEIVISGVCKQAVGQAAADVCNIGHGVRKREPYKGKGINYKNRKQRPLKEAKKKK